MGLIWYDTEFIERGYEHPIELISIGIIREDDQGYYAVAADGWDAGHASPWVIEHVLPHLGTVQPKPRSQIADEIREFARPNPRFISYYGAYDFVLLCQLYGRMIELPEGWPMWTYDVKQLAAQMGNPPLPEQTSIEHNALCDARHIKRMYEYLVSMGAKV
jgi:hypothetical protein